MEYKISLFKYCKGIKIGGCFNLVTILIVFYSLTAGATQEGERLDLETYVVKALAHGVLFLSSKIDLDIASAKNEASNNLYKGVFIASPFFYSYIILD